jgi:RNA polymerase sigma factor (sigma-70 family)
VRDIHTDPDDSGHDSNFILHETSPNNLTQYRWRGPILSPGEVADNLRATRGPEPGAAAAKDTLFKAFDRLVLKVVQPYCRDDGRNDDLIAAGMLGLVEAIDRFDTSRNNGFAAYAIPLIRGRAQKASKAINRNGWAGETRLQRAVYGNHDLTLEQASKRMGRPVDQDEIERARTEVLGMCSEPLPYDTTEPGFEDDDEEDRPGVLPSVAAPCPRQGIFNAALEKRHGRLNRLAEDADRREMRRLKEIGRRAYALELVERDRARIAARAEPTQYLYGPGVADPFGYILALLDISPRSSKPKSHTQKKRRSRIRAWRCSEPAALAA